MLGKLVSFMLVAVMLSGCITTSFREEVIDVDGTSAITEYAANAIVAPFSDLKPSNHLLDYEWGENRIRIGQESEGLDATPQIQALAVTFEALIAIAPLIAPILEVLKAQAPPLTPVEP